MKNYPIKATFIDEISYDMPSQNWTEEQWAKDFDNMQEIGIDTVVVMRSCFYDKCLYPSKIFPSLKKENEDFLELILFEAEKRNMSAYLGLYCSDLCWHDGDYEHEIENDKLFVDEALSRYGHYNSFKGWYIPQETSANSYNISYLMRDAGKLCKEKSPDKKVLISPFFPSYMSPERVAQEWDNIWKVCGEYIDICAFQDGTANFGNYTTLLSQMKKVAKKHNISLWANVETFERDVRNMYFPIHFDVLRKKIEIAEEFVDNFITFEFSHFLSPQSIFPSARNLNNLYKKYYEKK